MLAPRGKRSLSVHVGKQFSFDPIAAVVLPSGGVSIWINQFRQVARGVIHSDRRFSFSLGRFEEALCLFCGRARACNTNPINAQGFAQSLCDSPRDLHGSNRMNAYQIVIRAPLDTPDLHSAAGEREIKVIGQKH